MDQSITSQEIYSLIRRKLLRHFGRKPGHVRKEELYKATSMVIRDFLTEQADATNTEITEQEMKQIYYLSMEFLPGTSLRNNAYNLGIEKKLEDAISFMGYNLSDLYELEPDAGLGNGGLGRLASCYMDALSAERFPGCGMSICYEYGIFKQRINEEGTQEELPDDWTDLGSVWLIAKEDEIKKVRFGGRLTEEWDESGRMKIIHSDYTTVLAVPQEMLISGYQSEITNKLILWESRSPIEIDMKKFAEGKYMQAMEERYKAETISKILYPADEHVEGKTLRLQQQYFFVSASLQLIVSKYLEDYETLDNFPEKVAIHINDTHPTMAIPELMRILIDKHDFGWEQAMDMVKKTISYTNHTVMPEALEEWPEDLIKKWLPRIHSIIVEINSRQNKMLAANSEISDDIKKKMEIINQGKIKMANLCVEICHKVNGVSSLHSDIIRDKIFPGFSKIYPDKFTNVTNGIAYRRWLNQANEGLTELLDETIGKGYKRDATKLKDILQLQDDPALHDRLKNIKHENKKRLAKLIEEKNNIIVDPYSIFDVQVKRIHEYKRQLLNLVHIIYLYQKWQNNNNIDFYPRTFIFGGKAAPGYYLAKEIIRLAHNLSKHIEKTPGIRDKIKVVFLENYSVSMSEVIMPAAEVSEQISLAGKEASGTGNMKLMINGALTLGTLDGANVEIHGEVGDENIFIFGMTAEEVEEHKRRNNYNPLDLIRNDHDIGCIINMLSGKINDERFTDLLSYLTTGFMGKQDPYLVLADFESYKQAQERIDEAYRNHHLWNKMSLVNIGKAGFFSADNSVYNYARNIWDLNRL